MSDYLSVANSPKTATFQMRINPEIKNCVEDIYARCGMTLTDAINVFIQQTINTEGLPLIVTQNSKDALKEQKFAEWSEEHEKDLLEKFRQAVYDCAWRKVTCKTEGEKSRKMTLRKLGVSGFKKVHLLPLLFVAGYHARKDIAAESDSWKSVLEEAGYQVIPNLIGIGELAGIRSIFIEHLKNAMEQ